MSSGMASYETTVIIKQSAGEDSVSTIKSKVESIVAAHTGQFVNFEDWGTRRMTYAIQKENRGRYLYFTYTGNSGAVAEIERNLRINESVIRYLSILVSKEEKLDLLKEPSPMKRPARAPAESYDH